MTTACLSVGIEPEGKTCELVTLVELQHQLLVILASTSLCPIHETAKLTKSSPLVSAALEVKIHFQSDCHGPSITGPADTRPPARIDLKEVNQ